MTNLLIKQILEDHGFGFIDECDYARLTEDWLNERISEQEIVYYSEAIKYLAENDPSFTESLELARDLGFEYDKLNSEVLATLLYQAKLQEQVGYVLASLEALEVEEV